jgi:hypothetical protein
VGTTEPGFPPGREVARFGAQTLCTRDDVHELALHEPALELRARLTLRAASETSVLHRRIASGEGLHWAVTPRLLASGDVEVAGRRFAVESAPAYRDRNWGSFAFGDVAWDWGQLAAPADGPPCSLVFARLMNAARTRILEQHVLVWWDRSVLGSFRDRQVAFTSGQPYRGALPTIPPALALCRPGHATPVPEVVEIEAHSSRGELSIRFDREATARIMVPNDDRPGTTAIHESFGLVSANGHLDGREIAVAGRGIFECVHA